MNRNIKQPVLQSLSNVIEILEEETREFSNISRLTIPPAFLDTQESQKISSLMDNCYPILPNQKDFFF